VKESIVPTSLLFVLLCGTLSGQTPDPWVAVTNSHFEIYSQKGGESPYRALVWFERLRGVLLQGGFLPGIARAGDLPRVRVIGFRSIQEYNRYRMRPAADAYFAQRDRRNYIVVPSLEPEHFSLAAHEYAHFVLYATGLKLPPWLGEGLAEYCSTLQFTAGGYEIGGDIPGRMQLLKREKWIALAELLESQAGSSAQSDNARFYAQSWALVDMLITTPEYHDRLGAFIASLNSGHSSREAFAQCYGKSLEMVTEDLSRWVGRKQKKLFVALNLPEPAVGSRFALSLNQSDALLADLLVAMGEVGRARERYTELARRTPRDPDIHAALGSIAFRQGKREEAVREWRQALDYGLRDADLFFQYAEAAGEMGAPEAEVREALRRAVELRPGFDDARFNLGLLESNAGNYAAAVNEFVAMRVPQGARAYGYWAGLAYAYEELGRRGEAIAAAQKALQEAKTKEERQRATQIAYLASTDLKTQFVRDADGQVRLATTRVEAGTADFNPFVEPSDRMQQSRGQLSEVLCDAGRLKGFRVLTANGLLTVTVPDPQHVLIENGPHEFFCGEVEKVSVQVDYAVVDSAGGRSNTLRGMRFGGE
jgi:tetratricopeptide (TPR) repeat protein